MQAWRYLFIETRARVYLLWKILATGGFVATHLHQRKTINPFWFTLSLIGLGYMYRVMPLKVRQMRQIFLAWLVPITIGMAVSGVVFYVHTPWAGDLIANLGAFWLVIMAVGYLWNGLVDPPSFWYYFAAFINFVAALLCYRYADWHSVQYLIAAVISAWSMLNLWLLRS
jgi:hypothetical protein